jgi:hypothetical protein
MPRASGEEEAVDVPDSSGITKRDLNRLDKIYDRNDVGGEALWGSLSYGSPGILPVCRGAQHKTVAQTTSAPNLRDQTNLVMILILIQSDFRKA